jgi:hypothetical protein
MFNAINKLALVSALFMMSLQTAAQTYVAVAIDESGDWAWARKSKEVDAQLEALHACEKGGMHKCQLIYHTAFVMAVSKSEQRMGMSMSGSPLYEIHDIAIRECGLSDCVVTESITEPGFLAVAMSNKEPKVAGYDYGFDNPDDAIASEMKVCRKNADSDGCYILNVGAIRGDLDAVKTIENTSVFNSNQSQSCRPNTNPIRCTSNCVNGNCKVTYENGCVIEVTVQPKYDPLNNMWTYPSPQC